MIRAVILLLTAAAGMEGRLSPAYAPIELLFGASDAVVVARCISIGQKDPSQPSVRDGHLVPLDYLLRYSSIKVYKGSDVPAGFSVLFRQGDPAEGTPGCGPHYVLLFLKSSGSGDPYAWADPNFGLRAFPGQPLGGGAGPFGLRGLEQDALAFLSSGGEPSKTALNLLADFTELSKTSAEALATSKGPMDRAGAILKLEILVRAKRAEYFEELVREVQNLPALDPLTFTPERVCDLLEEGRNNKDLPALEELVTNSPVENPLRACAMRGLRSLRVRTSVPFLIRQLDDANLMVSYLAVITLAEITDKSGEYGPGMGLFEKDPQKYRRVWRNWWEQWGAKEYSSTLR